MVQLRDCKNGESYATVPHFTTVSNPLTPRLIILVMTRLLNPAFKSVDETLWCYHSIENSSKAELLSSVIDFYRFYNNLSHYKE